MTSPSKTPAATVKSEEKKRNAVFRQLLDSPFNVTWYGPIFLSIANRLGNLSTTTQAQ